MNEKLLCIVTPADRTYYRVNELAKEFLDKDGNIVHSTGTLPDGDVTEISASNAAIKHFEKGKLNGKVQIIDLADNSVTFSEEYLNGKLVSVTETAPKKEEKPIPLYAGTIVKTNQGTRSFYINGQQVAEQNMSKDGVLELLGTIPDGEVKEFNDKRQLISEAHYQANKLHGLFVHYDERGKVRSREHYKQGLLHGPAEYYYTRGGKMFCASCNYQDNLLQGSFILKDADNDLIREKTHFMKGLRHGERTFYYENGKTESQETFVNGVLHGERKIFYPDGALWFKEDYANGKPDGERIGYWPNGEKFLEELYADGLLHGERKTFTKDGSLITQEEYHWGKIVHNTESQPKKS